VTSPPPPCPFFFFFPLGTMIEIGVSGDFLSLPSSFLSSRFATGSDFFFGACRVAWSPGWSKGFVVFFSFLPGEPSELVRSISLVSFSYTSLFFD